MGPEFSRSTISVSVDPTEQERLIYQERSHPERTENRYETIHRRQIKRSKLD